MPKSWARERTRDFYYRKAKQEKYRSRATYKLLQMVEKYRFLKKGDVVVDLGAAPGGWLQAAAEIVGDAGLVLGVDLKTVQPVDAANVQTIVGDITDAETQRTIAEALTTPADVVISDVSPNISGVWEVDHARQIDLAAHSLKLALRILKTDGNFLIKVFHGDLFRDFVDDVRRHFARVEIVKPRASRPRSSEIYILAMGLTSRN